MAAATTGRLAWLLLACWSLLLGARPAHGQGLGYASGFGHSVSIHTDGTLWAWGMNSSGQLGDGTTTDRVNAVQVGTSTWRSVSASSATTLAIRQDGTLWGWGSNGLYQLGDGTTTARTSPGQIGVATWRMASVAVNNVLAIQQDGSLWAWGWNAFGQLGDGTTTNRTTPVKIGSDTWRSVSANTYYTVAIHTDGTLWAWGNNGSGQLGDGTTTSRTTPVKIGSDTWRSVSAGSGYTVAIRADGTLWAWGLNTYGQLGDGTTTNRTVPKQIGTLTTWSTVSAGEGYTVAVRTDGTLWAWGLNTGGQLGDGTTTNRLSPVRAGGTSAWQSALASASSTHTLALQPDGTLWAWGSNTYGQVGRSEGSQLQNIVPSRLGTDTWKAASLGPHHGAAIRQDGTLWTWGNNRTNQLGDGTTISRSTPAQIGQLTTWQSVSANGDGSASSAEGFTHAIRSDGSLWSWGTNSTSQLGDNRGTRSSPTAIVTTPQWRSVSTGKQYTLAIRQDGTLWAWGYNRDGQLGDGSTTTRRSPGQIGTITTWQSVSSSASINSTHSMAIRTDGTLWGWGSNNLGQLGNGSTTSSLVPTQVGSGTDWQQVSTGYGFTVALRTDGTLWTWGYNGSGELGDGTNVNKSLPQQIGSSTWRSISAGLSYVVAIRSDGTLWAWGYNYDGQLGDGTTTSRNVPVQIGANTTWQTVAANDAVTMAMRADGSLWLWGNNRSGQLGYDNFYTTAQRVDQQVLPVELTAFSARQEGPAAQLRWTTAQEKNNARFEVEASVDGQHFAPVGTVAGQGSTTRRTEYQFADAGLLHYAADVVYYRLRQVDHDGTINYSAVRPVGVQGESAKPQLTLLPTVAAAGQPVQYRYTGPALPADAQLAIYDALGRPVGHQPAATAGALSPQKLPAGWYFVRLRTATGTVQDRFYQP